MKRVPVVLSILISTVVSTSTALGESLSVAGIFSSQTMYQTVEKELFETLRETSGVDVDVVYRPVDQLGVKARDLLRLVGTGTFDVMMVGVPIVAGDHPLLEAVDIAGVSPTPEGVAEIIAAYKPILNEMLEREFNTKLVGIFHFGPIQLFCTSAINNLDDLKGKKVRTFTKSQAALMQELGSITVDLNFAEVYTALQRGVVDCAATNPSGANTSKIVEVATHYIPIAISQMAAGYFMNLDKWNAFSPEDQEKLAIAFDRLERSMIARSIELDADAVKCNIGVEPCKLHDKYTMEQDEISQEVFDEVRSAAARSTVAQWAEECDKRSPGCSAQWNELVGKKHGIMAEQ